ncbi:hypothetical protein, partial [Polycladomyces subterraneus]
RPLEHEAAEPITYFARVGMNRFGSTIGWGKRSAHVSQGKSLLPLWAQDPKDFNNRYSYPLVFYRYNSTLTL